MKFKFIQPQDPDYSKELMLRWEVLHKPLGKSPGSEVGPEESKSLHLLAFDKKEIVGCVLFYPETEASGKLYEMAVSEEYRGRGFGRKLITTLEQAVLKQGIKEVHLLAKEEVVPFYLGVGYHLEGNVIEKMGISYQEMSKHLK